MKTPISLPLAALTAILTGPVHAAEILLESAPPVIVRTEPVAGATNVDPRTSEIVVQFSKPMRDGSWSWSTWGEENFPEMTGDPHYQPDGKTCVLPVKLEPGKFYATWLNSDKFRNFKDTNGRAAVPYLLTFTTVGEPPGSGAKASGTEAESRRKFVRVVLDGERMTFAGKPATWDSLENQLSAIPDREHTVLEWGVPSTQITLQQQNNWTTRFAALAKKHGFEYSSYVGVQAFGSKGGMPPTAQPTSALSEDDLALLLNDDQKAVVAWTERQFRGFFDERTFDGWADEEVQNLEAKSIDALNGPRSREYYQAINTLGALRSTNVLSRLREIAFEQVDRNNRDRWMSVRVLGIMGDRQSVPDLIHLVYHGNQNTHWWAQISLVRLTGQNFGGDWNAWGKWWNETGGQPAYDPEIIRWWSGQPEPDKLAGSLAENNRKFLNDIRSK